MKLNPVYVVMVWHSGSEADYPRAVRKTRKDAAQWLTDAGYVRRHDTSSEWFNPRTKGRAYIEEVEGF